MAKPILEFLVFSSILSFFAGALSSCAYHEIKGMSQQFPTQTERIIPYHSVTDRTLEFNWLDRYRWQDFEKTLNTDPI